MISILVTTRNHDQVIGEVLEALHFCEDVIVVDRGSTDNTLEIAKTFANVRIGGEPIHDWVLALNGSEVVSEELANELKELEPNIDYVYKIPVHTFFNGKQIRHGGWHSRGELRLTHRKHPDLTKTQALKNPINRYPFASVADLLKRITNLSERHNSKPSFFKTLLAPPFSWAKAYIFQLGFLDGFEGHVLAKYRAHRVFYSQLTQREFQKPPIEGAPISDDS